jgi:hypothetical protein
VPWKVTGAPSSWEAVNDNVTELQTPLAGTYMWADAVQPFVNVVEFGYQVVPLNGSAVTSETLWTYVSASGPIRVEVRSGGAVLAEDLFGSTGWRSLSVPLSGSQTQLNNLRVRYFGGNVGGSTATVEASFLRLVVDPGLLRIKPPE